MLKKSLSLIILSVFICTVFTACGEISASTESEAIKYTITENGAIVKSVPNKSNVKHIIIPDEHEGLPVVAIADFAVVNLEYATEITIGKNVKEIGTWALENNQHVTAFNVDDDNPYFCDVDGVLFTKDMKTLLFYPLARNVTESTNDEGENIRKIVYAVPEGVKTIRTKAFYKCGNLRGITLPDSITSIEEKAFFRCSLEELTLPSSLEYIGKDAFSYCENIKDVTIPSTVREIGEYAFFNCFNLHTVNVSAKQEDLTLGKSWYPTNNGGNIPELNIVWEYKATE